MEAIREVARWFPTAGVLLLLIVSCSGGNVLISGIEGKVTIGPSCPEIQDAVPCKNSPFETSLVIVEPGTQQEVATVRSGADGTFRVQLPPGDYIIKQASSNQFVPPYANPQQVTVHEGEFATIEIVYDSGIR